jgi:hypothetical protein
MLPKNDPTYLKKCVLAAYLLLAISLVNLRP